MDPKTTAVVLIEYQNDFTTEGGTLHGAVKGVMDSNNMLANTVELVAKVRKIGAAIVFTPISFTDDYHELAHIPTASSKAWWIASRSEKVLGAPRSWTF